MNDNSINDEFKKAFKNFIDGTINKEGNTEPTIYKLSDSIENTTYYEVNYDGKINFTTSKVEFPVNIKPSLWVPKIDQLNPQGIKEESNGISFDSSSNKYTIKVKSYFKTQAANTGVIGENSRTVQATYVMSVPNYKDIYFQNVTGELHEYLAFKDRALTIGGNMNVNSATGLTVNGDMFVEGKDPTLTSETRTVDKYHGGITISDSKQVKFNDDIITRNTINIQDDVEATINGNLYARNVYAGKLDNGFASSSILNVNNIDANKGQVIIDNDLALKASKSSTINIKDFYGINDKNINYENGDISNRGNSDDVTKSSSSIIVNGNDDSTNINITNSAYIMGTAHINTKDDNGYQTGESAAVKGNYKAYSVPLNETEKFAYYDPLQLLDESNVFNKANHFAQYWR